MSSIRTSTSVYESRNDSLFELIDSYLDPLAGAVHSVAESTLLAPLLPLRRMPEDVSVSIIEDVGSPYPLPSLRAAPLAAPIESGSQNSPTSKYFDGMSPVYGFDDTSLNRSSFDVLPVEVSIGEGALKLPFEAPGSFHSESIDGEVEAHKDRSFYGKAARMDEKSKEEVKHARVTKLGYSKKEEAEVKRLDLAGVPLPEISQHVYKKFGTKRGVRSLRQKIYRMRLLAGLPTPAATQKYSKEEEERLIQLKSERKTSKEITEILRVEFNMERSISSIGTKMLTLRKEEKSKSSDFSFREIEVIMELFSAGKKIKDIECELYTQFKTSRSLISVYDIIYNLQKEGMLDKRVIPAGSKRASTSTGLTESKRAKG